MNKVLITGPNEADCVKFKESYVLTSFVLTLSPKFRIFIT